MGVQCDTANLGLAALAYAAVGLVDQYVGEEPEIVLFSINSQGELARMAESLGLAPERITAVPFYRKNPAALIRSFRAMRDCDLILDFTGGDSFSDIYGTKRIAKKLGDKQMALASGAPFVLAPQTFGPFERRLTLPWAKHVINRADLVCTRDHLSRAFLAGMTKREVLVASDVAVTLPWSADLFDLPATNRRRVGFNVSGLLWNGGYTGRNQFGLAADYKDFCRTLVRRLETDGAEVHLVPHVVSRGDADDEDDVAACRALAEGHPGCIVAPRFRSPVEAKSYISGMDVLVGSRMHATIASLTCGVPTIPVAYSRKFAGFFQNIGYDVLVDLAVLDAGPAVDATMGYVAQQDEMAAAAAAGTARAQELLRSFGTRLAGLVAR